VQCTIRDHRTTWWPLGEVAPGPNTLEQHRKTHGEPEERTRTQWVETCLRRTRAPCGGEEGEIEEEELKDAEGGC
jgi:hypothetical protein